DGGRRSGGVTAARRTRLGGKWPHPVPCAARCDNRQAAPRGGRAHRGAAAASAARAAPALRASTLALRRRRGERHGARGLLSLRRPAVVAFGPRRVGMHALPPAGGG